jgi:AraC-like DNA-binding protein
VTAAPAFTDTIVFETPLVRIGAFRCDAEFPGFENTGPAENDCFVFPRTAVEIEHEHEPRFPANANIITFYNRSQRYIRRKISGTGDRCDWFGVDRDLAREVVRRVDPSVEERPFSWTHRSCDSRTYLIQRQLFHLVTRAPDAEPAAVEETVILLLERAIQPRRLPKATPKQRALVYDVECLLGAFFDQPLSLADIARQSGASVYHLCRTFRRVTGVPLHQYRHRLRLRHGLEPVIETRDGLSRIAVDLGFTHHSHFTGAFRREFGATPSQLRQSRLTPLEITNTRPE